MTQAEAAVVRSQIAAGHGSWLTSRRTGSCSGWDISPQWRIESDPELTSEVQVRFIAETPHRTRLELEHRRLDRHGPGPGWQSVHDGVNGDEGWPLYLTRYAALISGDS